jgi:hypothetical protein
VSDPADGTVPVHGAPEPDAVPLSERIRVSVLDRIASLGEQALPREVVAAARELEVLPLEPAGVDWLGLRPDGDLVLFRAEPASLGERVTHPWTRATVLLRAAERYDALDGLLGPPPRDRRTCPVCGGLGTIVRDGVERRCVCGGVGWLSPISDPPPATRVTGS